MDFYRGEIETRGKDILEDGCLQQIADSTEKPYVKGHGKNFGIMMHHFAHRNALGLAAEWKTHEAERIFSFLKELKADSDVVLPEIECSVPIGKAVIRGIIDLLAVNKDTATIIDYKSDLTDINEKEYIKQLSVYAHAVKEEYPGRKIKPILYYVCLDSKIEVNPLSMEELEEIVKTT